MAYADAVKAGVGIDPDRRAYHMLTRSGVTRSITLTVSCTIPRLSDQGNLQLSSHLAQLVCQRPDLSTATNPLFAHRASKHDSQL